MPNDCHFPTHAHTRVGSHGRDSRDGGFITSLKCRTTVVGASLGVRTAMVFIVGGLLTNRLPCWQRRGSPVATVTFQPKRGVLHALCTQKRNNFPKVLRVKLSSATSRWHVAHYQLIRYVGSWLQSAEISNARPPVMVEVTPTKNHKVRTPIARESEAEMGGCIRGNVPISRAVVARTQLVLTGVDDCIEFSLDRRLSCVDCFVKRCEKVVLP